MLFDLLATFAAGAGLAAVAIVARHLSGGRLPKWLTPAALGLGMLLFSVWNEYTWYERTAAAMPESVIILSAPTESVMSRPWTYLFPVATRFAAFDGTSLKKSEANPAVRGGDVIFVARWTPLMRVPLGFDCAASARVDLLDGAALSPDGTLTGATWQPVDPTDALQRAACQESSG